MAQGGQWYAQDKGFQCWLPGAINVNGWTEVARDDVHLRINNEDCLFRESLNAKQLSEYGEGVRESVIDKPCHTTMLMRTTLFPTPTGAGMLRCGDVGPIYCFVSVSACTDGTGVNSRKKRTENLSPM